jgi:PKHD-type hydroxylase
MLIQITDLLDAATVARLRAGLAREGESFESGKKTAGWQARAVKNNEQSAGPAAQEAMETVRRALEAHALVRSAARPKEFVRLLVSRSREGMGYGTHVDDALMAGRRTDLSFTCSLTDPGTYDGGELVIEEADGENAIRLPAGGVVVYPTTALHRVETVTRGERLVVVGWIRSFIRDPARRDMLFDLDQAVAMLRDAGADRPVMNLISRTRNNLIRMWAED